MASLNRLMRILRERIKSIGIVWIITCDIRHMFKAYLYGILLNRLCPLGLKVTMQMIDLLSVCVVYSCHRATLKTFAGRRTASWQAKPNNNHHHERRTRRMIACDALRTGKILNNIIGSRSLPLHANESVDGLDAITIINSMIIKIAAIQFEFRNRHFLFSTACTVHLSINT